jgi:ATP-binding cassette subfamily B protein
LLNQRYAPNYDLKKSISANRLKGLWRLMSGFHGIYVVAAISLGIAALSKTGTYMLLRFFTDEILINQINVELSNDTIRRLILIALGFVLLAVIEGTFTFASGRLAARTGEGVALRLRDYLFDHIQRLSFTYHDHTNTGDLVQRSSSDVDAIRRFYSDQAIGLSRIIMIFTVNFLAIMRLNVTLALASVVAIPLVVITSILFFRKISKAYEAYQEQDAVLSTTLQENLTGVRVVKAFARQDYEKAKFDGDNKEKFSRGRKLLLMHSGFWPVSDIICGGQMLAGFTIAAIMAINNQITVGTYLAYVGLVIWLIWPMRNLGRLIVQASTGLVSYGRVMDIIKEDREQLTKGLQPPSDELRGEIVFKGVDFQYGEDIPILEDISFRCEPGQIIALVGPTGSGKTSLVNLLPRFYEYTNGSIKLDGVELNQYARQFLRREIGIVEQEPFLFSRTIKENISYGAGDNISDDNIEAVAQAAAIHDVIMSFPDGYDTLIGEKGVTLSGGQKQRVAIARTLLKDPRILILDDATSSVDTETEAEIRTALGKLMKGRTSFIIAHRIQSVMFADIVLVLEGGRIVQRGTHDELLSQEGIYRRIYNVQTRIEAELEQEIAKADMLAV